MFSSGNHHRSQKIIVMDNIIQTNHAFFRFWGNFFLNLSTPKSILEKHDSEARTHFQEHWRFLHSFKHFLILLPLIKSYGTCRD